MSNKLHILPSEEADWETKASQLQGIRPLKTLSCLPKMEGITSKTRRFLKGKALFYLIAHDNDKIFLRYFFKHPFTYTLALLKSYLSRPSFTREGDFFFYGLQKDQEFLEEISHKDTHLIVGFSYCHKPFECPSGRFSSLCENDPNSPVCGQCFIGKCSSLLEKKNAEIVYIPTIHAIGQIVFAATQKHKKVRFLITACELSLTMFADWGHMVRAKGIGVRLDGRICNTFQAFSLSEKGIKPGLTVVLDTTKERILRLLRQVPLKDQQEKKDKNNTLSAD